MGSVQQPLELLSPVRGIHVYTKRHKKPNVRLADIDIDPSKDFLKSFEDGSIAKDEQDLKAETQGDRLREEVKTEELTKQQDYNSGTPQAENQILAKATATGTDVPNESNEQLKSSNGENEQLKNATESSGDKMMNNAQGSKAEESTGGSTKELNQVSEKVSKPQLGYVRRKRQRHTAANLEDKPAAPAAVALPEPENPSEKKETKGRSKKNLTEYSEHEEDGEEEEEAADEEEYKQQEEEEDEEEEEEKLEEQEKGDEANRKETSKEVTSSKGRKRSIPTHASRSRDSGAKRRRRGSKVAATSKNKAGKNSNNNRTSESSEEDGNLSDQVATVAEKARSIGLSEGVYKWLRELGLLKYAEYFERHEVEDEVLPLLTFGDLREMGICAVGARRKMFTSIQEMDSKRKHNDS